MTSNLLFVFLDTTWLKIFIFLLIRYSLISCVSKGLVLLLAPLYLWGLYLIWLNLKSISLQPQTLYEKILNTLRPMKNQFSFTRLCPYHWMSLAQLSPSLFLIFGLDSQRLENTHRWQYKYHFVATLYTYPT